MRKGLLIVGVVPVFALGVQGVLAGTAQTTSLHATLNARQQVPPQVVKAANASGRFTATLLRYSSGRGKLSWRLNYSHLSSQATYAYISLPASGKTGEVVVQLCKARGCTPTTVGTSLLLAPVTRALATRAGYVSVQTKKNPRGEIRGKLTSR